MNGDAVQLVLGDGDSEASCSRSLDQDILFMDPPWGGVDYMYVGGADIEVNDASYMPPA